jgi:3-hydroxyisobutyrate dehydrogenase-like beta-hydroxyacid dehydrogenase
MPKTHANHPDVPTVAVVRIGTMGSAMAANLRKAGVASASLPRTSLPL